MNDLADILHQLADDIRANMASNNINASHRTEQSLRVEEYDGGYRVVIGGKNTAPLATLEIGRPGGDVPGGFVTLKDGRKDVSKTF